LADEVFFDFEAKNSKKYQKSQKTLDKREKY
jgi:hypothetical protein